MLETGLEVALFWLLAFKVVPCPPPPPKKNSPGANGFLNDMSAWQGGRRWHAYSADLHFCKDPFKVFVSFLNCLIC